MGSGERVKELGITSLITRRTAASDNSLFKIIARDDCSRRDRDDKESA